MRRADAEREVEQARERVASDLAEFGYRFRHPVRRRRQRQQPTPAIPPPADRDAVGLTDLPRREYVGVFRRAASQLMANNMMSVGKGVAYSTFFAIPSALLVVIGILNLTASPADIASLVDRLDGVVPSSVQTLLLSNLRQVTASQGGGLMVVLGFGLAIWSVMGAVQSMIWGLNIAYERREQRGFVRQRIAALTIAIVLTAALVAVFAVLVLAPYMVGWVGDAVGYPGAVGWLWWTLQWPILFVVLLAAFAAVLYLGPDADHPRFRFITPGAVAAAVLWIAGSALFAVYTAGFASYNKTWGSVAGVIVTLTWLWLNAVSILFAAEVNVELERTREVRSGTLPSATLTVPHR
jgi:membrane protein